MYSCTKRGQKRMNSSFSCHLSKPVYRSPHISRMDYEKERKEYFNKNLKKKVIFFKGKETKLLFSEKQGDECFYKFARGSEENHRKKDGSLRTDRYRLERLDWIFEILEKVEECEKCIYHSIFPDQKHTDRINVSCIYNSYKVVICIKECSDSNVIVTAYYLRERKKAY